MMLSDLLMMVYVVILLRLHCSIDILNIVILLDTLDKLLDVCLCVTFENLEVNVRKACELCSNEFVTVLLDPFLDGVERCELTVEYDFHFFVFVLLLEDLLYAIVDKLKLELLEVVWVCCLHAEHALAVEHVVDAA